MGRWTGGRRYVVLRRDDLLSLVGEPVWALITGAADALHACIVTIMPLTGSFRDGSGRLITYPGQRLRTPHTSDHELSHKGFVPRSSSVIFGAFGDFRFYLGKIGTGVPMLLTFGGLGVWTLLDTIIIITGNFGDGDAAWSRPRLSPSRTASG